jgi:membrane protease YdiL (CAAX protease family)
MSETVNGRKSPFGAWLAIAAFMLLWGVVFAIGPIIRNASSLFLPHGTVREIAAGRAFFSVVFSWLALAGTMVILRVRGQRLADTGWGRPAAIWGWIAAAVFVAFYAWFGFNVPLRPGGSPVLSAKEWLTDWSMFRIVAALAVGITSGICEETMFRGFVMNQARDGRAPMVVQVLLAAILFGLAHAPWGGMAGHFDLAATLGASVSTAVIGLLFAIIFVLSRRSITPAVIGHTVFNFIWEPWMLMFAIHGSFAAH